MDAFQSDAFQADAFQVAVAEEAPSILVPGMKRRRWRPTPEPPVQPKATDDDALWSGIL